MKEILKGKCILVCDFEYWPLVFRLKTQNPNAEWKVMKKDDLLDRISFSFAKDPIPFLMKKGVDYANSKKYLRILRVSDFASNKKLNDLFLDLQEEGFLKSDELGMLEVSRSNVLLLEREEDLELHECLKRKSIPFHDVTLEDLGGEKKITESCRPPLLSFPDKFTQYFYLYSSIRKELLENPKLKDRITILIRDESDLYYIKTISSLFDIPSFAAFSRPFLSNPTVKEKVNWIYQTKSFAFSKEEEEKAELKELQRIVEHYGLATLPFDFAYSSLIEIANTLSVKEKMDDRGITIENRFTIDPSQRIFVTNFQYGDFYKVHDDKNVLTDQEMAQISANPSYVLTKLDRRKKTNYLLYNEIALLSRARQHLTDKIYDSQLIEEFGWNPEKDVQRVGMNFDGVYTSKSERLLYADQLDKQFYPFAYEGYRSYDHSFKGVNRQVVEPTKTWSITDLEKLILCPFQYYLSIVIPPQDEDKHALWLGILAHKVMERVFADDFVFEEEFEKGVAEYRKSVAKSGQAFTPKESAWIDVAKYWLKEIVAKIQESKICGTIVEERSEQMITFDLQDDEGTVYTFKNAKIDKILITEHEGQKYYTIIDYKTGKENFEATTVFLGRSSQLPLYYYAVEHSPTRDDLVKDGIFGGFAIVHNYAPSPKNVFAAKGKLSKDNATALIRGKGVFRDSVPFWRSLDISAINEEGEVGFGCGIYYGPRKTKLFLKEDDQNTSIIPNCTITPTYNFNSMIEDAKASMIAAIRRILNNDFTISPTSLDLRAKDFSKLVCSHCPYGDICYRDPKHDAVSYEKTIADRFFPKDELANQSDDTVVEDTENE